jgi:Uncharacterized conserved protein
MKRHLSILLSVLLSAVFFSCGNSDSGSKSVDYEMSYDVSGVTLDMVRIPAGNFTMHLSSDNRRKVNGGSVHEVALDGFVISAQPVSQALWTAVMGSNPSSVQNPSAPVDKVSWNDAKAFLRKLGKATGKSFYLPTEAQWEYAVKTAGSVLGVSVAEWCEDSFDMAGDYFNDAVLTLNPAGPKVVDRKVIRTVNERMDLDSHTSKAGVGFRVVQPTEDVISEQLLGVLDGKVVDREAIDAADGKAETFTVGGVTFKMVKVKGGEFTMGFQDTDSPYSGFAVPENEKNAHQVTLSDFEIGETEVTVALWNAVMGSVPYLNEISEPQKPVGNVSWYNCQTFIGKLNALTGRKFRLPTEAEWEYAARGGALSRHYGFSGSNDPKKAMWYLDNAEMKPKNVKGKAANELGIYDMSGNVWEWCFDKAGDYPVAAQTDPLGADEGTTRILRGGSAASKWEACRISNRSYMPAKNVKGTFGLRLAL